MKKYIWTIAFVLSSTAVLCQEVFSPPTVKQTVSPAKINTTLKIDGILDEPEWKLAAVVNALVETDPVQSAIPRKKTIIRILYNKDQIFFGITCYDTVGRNKYRTLNLKRDFSAANTDFFALAIDGYNDERNCAMFGMNPYGVQRDLLCYDDTYTNPDWNGLWTLRTQRSDTAWIAEVAIPWKTLRYKKTDISLQTLGISFARIARSINEKSNWPAIPRAFDGLRMSYAGKLTNMQAPVPNTNIQLTPYALFSRSESFRNGFNTGSKNILKPGAI